MKHSIFIKSVGSLLFVVCLGILLMFRANKPKSEFMNAKGKISYIKNRLPLVDGEPDLKKRYLQIEGIDRTFEIFIGKDRGDFKPEYQIIDSLKIGDSIDLYFDDNSQTESSMINHLTQYIDKNGKAYYIEGRKDATFGKFLIIISVLCISILILLKRSRKID